MECRRNARIEGFEFGMPEICEYSMSAAVHVCAEETYPRKYVCLIQMKERMNIKIQYWKYSLIVIILLLGVIIFFELTPFLGGILGAITIYILLRNQMIFLVTRKHMRRSIMAMLILAETILLFLIPLSLVVWLFISKLQAINLQPSMLIEPVEHIADVIREKTGYNVLSRGNLNSVITVLPRVGRVLMGNIVSFAVNVLILLFVLYFMLVGGKKMEAYINDLLPFSRRNKRDVLHEFNMVIKSNAIGVPLLAIIQGAVASLGYFLFGLPEVFLLGVLSSFATILPIIGTAIVWIPLCLYLGTSGHWGNAIGLAVYCLLIVGNADNVGRFILQKKLADTHPLITIFGVVIGLSLFGFMGVIFGPLMLAIFILCVQIFKEEYLDS